MTHIIWKAGREWIEIVRGVLIVAAAILFLSSTASAQSETKVDTLPESVMNTRIRTLDDEVFKLSDGEEKLRIIVLLASWCGPCQMAAADLSRDRLIYTARGVDITGLTTEDPVDDRKSVQNFVRKRKIAFRIGWINEEFAKTLAAGRNIIPQIIVITKDGRVIKRFVGYNPAATLINLRNAVEPNL